MVDEINPELLSPAFTKQDCELNAGKRWLSKHSAEYAWLKPTLLGDALYAHYPFCRQILDAGMSFIFTRKDTTHKWLTETLRNSFTGKQPVVKWTGKKRLVTYE
jgi:hypothetical protein